MQMSKIGFLGPLFISLFLLVWEELGPEEQGLPSRCRSWLILPGHRARQTGN